MLGSGHALRRYGCHCEEQSDEAIPLLTGRLRRFTRNDDPTSGRLLALRERFAVATLAITVLVSLRGAERRSNPLAGWKIASLRSQ